MRRLLLTLCAGAALSLLASGVALADTTTTSGTTTTTTPVTTTPVTTTTVKPVYVAPLTGRPDPTHATQRRSALTVKIDNTPEAHPQTGLEDADVIYEEIVEGGITRLAAIFDSDIPTIVGPVRSVRRTDREIVFPIGGLFAFSGGAEYAVRSIATAPVKLFDQSTSGGAMFRNLSRPPPHNLYADAQTLMKMGGKPHRPRALFTYEPSSSPPRGAPVGSFSVGFASGYATSYQWNGRTHSWARSIFGAPDVTTSGVQLSPTNVIVLFVNYVGGVGVIDSYAQMIGSGPVDVFSDGRLQKGRWSRSSLREPTAYRSASGRVIALRPGQTLVELLASSETVSVYAPR